MFRVHTPIIRSIRWWVAAYGFLHRVFGEPLHRTCARCGWCRVFYLRKWCLILIKLGIDHPCAFLIKFNFNVYRLKNNSYTPRRPNWTATYICQKLSIIQKNNIWNEVLKNLSEMHVTFILNIFWCEYFFFSFLHKTKYLLQQTFIGQSMSFV